MTIEKYAPFPSLELVSIDMGYGHLRPAYSLSRFLGGQPILLADEPPLASTDEQLLWKRARFLYEGLSKAGSLPGVGPLLSEVLDLVTSIPNLYPRRDLSAASLGSKALARASFAGLGRGLAARLDRQDQTLLTTFYAPAVLAHAHGQERIYCVVTDTDVNRIWAPVDARRSRVRYLAPTQRVRRRLKSYGVPGERSMVTGFPLPHELIGGPEAPLLRKNLRRRLAALDPRGRFLHESRGEVAHFLGDSAQAGAAPHLVFAVGGAGAQTEMVRAFLPSLARRIRKGRLRITLVAGIRPEVSARFQEAISASELEPELASGAISILLESSHAEYFARFHQLLSTADILWTKPSELCFYGALGLPLILSRPLGSHERENRRYAVSSGAGLRQLDPAHAGDWLYEMLKDGTLAGAAWTGYIRMPKFGLYRIVEEVLGRECLERLLAQSGAETATEALAIGAV